MCGIFGYVGSRKDSIQRVVEGLRSLEYRGYDSAGFAAVRDQQLVYCKAVGKVTCLEERLRELSLEVPAAIAQTRWATHGAVTVQNAHPHFDRACSLAVVHNGIIENHELLRRELEGEGVSFVSDTDTEVIAHLIASVYRGNLLESVQHAVSRLKGSYAIALIHRDHPDQIIGMAHEVPLIIGVGEQETFLSSDPHAFLSHTRRAIYLSHSEIAVIGQGEYDIYSSHQERIAKPQCVLTHEMRPVSKGTFAHYTLKEIHEQPQAIESALASRLALNQGTAILPLSDERLRERTQAVIIGCGTSWHAGLIAAYQLQELAHFPVQVEIASEFRYKQFPLSRGAWVIVISQSGETADTLAAAREAKRQGAWVTALCNVPGSTLAREADETLFLHAGAEIGVCSTKAFTNQVVVLSLLTLALSRLRGMDGETGRAIAHALIALPRQAHAVLDQASHIAHLARRYAAHEHVFYLGRRYMYPAGLEGALKLKEMAYVNANGYPAGEMKHGPLALIDEHSLTIALCAERATYDKLLNNLMEIKARRGNILAIASDRDPQLERIADEVLYVPLCMDVLASIPISIALQLFAYYVAEARGTDIDRPRNLAKSVTVE